MGDKFNAVSEKVGKARVERQERKDRTLVDKYKSPQTQIIRVLGRKKREEVRQQRGRGPISEPRSHS